MSAQQKSGRMRLSVADVRVALLLSFGAFLVLRAVHIVIRFQSLGLPSVIGATAIFVAMAVAWAAIAIRLSGFRFERPANPLTWVVAAAMTLFWWLASSPVNSGFTRVYAPEFPDYVLDAGEGVAADTFHHSSMIFTIMNFGYPSTGLDGTPFTPYHVLSHYVDAGILSLTGLTPLVAVGFLLQLKIMLFVFAVLTLLWTQLRNMPAWMQWLAPVLLLPAFSATWHVVGSQGLWFTSLLVIVTAPFVWRMVSSSTAPTGRALVVLGLLGAALSVGKISTGFMFMFVVGLVLWLAHMKDWRIYALGVSWGVFMFAYASLIASDRPNVAAQSFTLYKRVYALARLVLLRDISANLILGLYALILLFALVTILRPTSLHKRLLGISMGGTALLAAMAFAKMDKSDRWYFAQALFFILFTIAIGVIAQFAGDRDRVKLWRLDRREPLEVVVAVTALVLFGLLGWRSSDFSALNLNPSVVTQSLGNAFVEGTRPPANSKGGLVAFKDSLAVFLADNDLDAHNARLFIPREIWQVVVANPKMTSDPETLWPLPLMVYAETGIPLHKGVVSSHGSYGFSAYDDDSLSPTRAEFEAMKNCGDTAIIEVTSWKPAKFSLACEAQR